MGLIAKDKGGGNFEMIPAGVHHAICYGVIDLGTQYSELYNNDSRKVMLIWELPEERITIDGKDLPRAISRRFTLSLNSKATLRAILESWRSRAFTEKELEGFDLKTIIGANCQVSVVHETYTRNGQQKTSAKVAAVMPLGKGVTKRKAENEAQYFSFDDGMEIPEGLPEWIVEIIHKSAEVNTENLPPPEKQPQKQAEDENIPF